MGFIKHQLALILGTTPTSGGGHDYELRLASLVAEVCRSLGLVLSYFHLSTDQGLVELEGFVPETTKVLPAREAIARVSGPTRAKGLRRILVTTPEKQLRKKGIELVHFGSPNQLAKEFSLLPLISTVWDLGHRDLPGMPEFQGSTGPKREAMYRATLPESFHVFTDSLETGRKLCNFYGVKSDSWSSLGLLVGKATEHEISEKNKRLLGQRPIFIYPAKRWPHKNHLFLLEAMKLLLQSHPEAQLVLTGDKGGGEQDAITMKIRQLGIEDNVLDLGFIPQSEVLGITHVAAGLVMPSLLGPTNIPPLQALSVGTPAIVSDAHKFDAPAQQQMIVLGTDSPNSWAKAMSQLIGQNKTKPYVEDIRLAREELARVYSVFFGLEETGPRGPT